MTFQERKNIVSIIATTLITGIYAFIMYSRYSAGLYENETVMRFWAIAILLFIPITIVIAIVIEIVVHIIEAIRNEIKGEDNELLGVTDERDKLIELKSTRLSMFVFAIGFVVALFTQLFNASEHMFFITIVVFGFLSDVSEKLLTIRYYRKGV